MCSKAAERQFPACLAGLVHLMKRPSALAGRLSQTERGRSTRERFQNAASGSCQPNAELAPRFTGSAATAARPTMPEAVSATSAIFLAPLTSEIGRSLHDWVLAERALAILGTLPAAVAQLTATRGLADSRAPGLPTSWS